MKKFLKGFFAASGLQNTVLSKEGLHYIIVNIFKKVVDRRKGPYINDVVFFIISLDPHPPPYLVISSSLYVKFVIFWLTHIPLKR